MSKNYWIYNCIVAVSLLCILTICFAVTGMFTRVTCILTSVYAFSSIWWLIQHTQNKNTESNTRKRDKLIEFALTTTFVDLIIVLLANDYGRWIPDEIRWYCIVAVALLVSVISAIFAIKEQEQ